MGQAEASGTVEASRRDLFYYTDWCYNVPEWFAPVRKTRILRLPDASGAGKVTRYNGTLLGREMEWEARSADWKEGEIWTMKASEGMPASMHMQIRFRFEDLDGHRTKVTCSVGYHAPYPVFGALMDRFMLRKEAQRLASLAIEGLQGVAEKGRVRPVEIEFEKRKLDHPGYGVDPAATVTSAPVGV